jgi:hypothetical protein
MAADGRHGARRVIPMTAPVAAAALLAAAPATTARAAGGWQVTAQSSIAGSTPSTATVSGSGTAGRLVVRADSGVRVSVRIRLRCADAGGTRSVSRALPAWTLVGPGAAPFVRTLLPTFGGAARCAYAAVARSGWGGAVEAALEIRP